MTLPVDDPRWTTLVRSSPDALPFHDPAWIGLLTDCYGFGSFVAALEGPDGRPVAGVPVIESRRPFGRPRWTSLPFSDRCPVLGADEGDRTAVVAALAAAAPDAGVGRVEVRDRVAAPAGARAVPGDLEHRLELAADVDEARARVHPTHRRNVRTALRAGVHVRRGDRATDLTGAYYGLHVETRRRQGAPVQPRHWFALLWERLVAPGHGVLLLAEHRGRPVAGAVFLTSPATVVYKYGASSAEGRALRANDLVMWHAVEQAVADGRTWLDLGRTAPSNAGLARFKRGWGAEETASTTVVVGRPGRVGGEMGGLARTVLRTGPRVLVRISGAILYRYAT